MQANDTSFSNVLGTLQYQIPYFQRSYVWKQEHVKSKFSTNNFKKIRIPQFSETRFGSFVGLFLVYKQ